LPIFIHYTSKAGAQGILASKAITDKHRNEKRSGSKSGIYVNPPAQQFSPENAEILLFLGNDKYKGSADYAVIFAWDTKPEEIGPVTQGSWVKEFKIHGDIKLTKENILYIGPNPFPDVFSATAVVTDTAAVAGGATSTAAASPTPVATAAAAAPASSTLS